MTYTTLSRAIERNDKFHYFHGSKLFPRTRRYLKDGLKFLVPSDFNPAQIPQKYFRECNFTNVKEQKKSFDQAIQRGFVIEIFKLPRLTRKQNNTLR